MTDWTEADLKQNAEINSLKAQIADLKEHLDATDASLGSLRQLVGNHSIELTRHITLLDILEPLKDLVAHVHTIKQFFLNRRST